MRRSTTFAATDRRGTALEPSRSTLAREEQNHSGSTSARGVGLRAPSGRQNRIRSRRSARRHPGVADHPHIGVDFADAARRPHRASGRSRRAHRHRCCIASPHNSTTPRTPSPRSGGPTGRARSSIVAAGTDAQFAAWPAAATPTSPPPPPASASCSPPAPRAMSDDSLANRVAPRAFPLRGARRDRRRCAALAHRGRRRLRRPPADAPARELGRRWRSGDCPTDADLTRGPDRSLAYDRAWWFSRFVAEQYGTATLRALYVRACGHGHPDAGDRGAATPSAPTSPGARRVAAVADRLA